MGATLSHFLLFSIAGVLEQRPELLGDCLAALSTFEMKKGRSVGAAPVLVFTIDGDASYDAKALPPQSAVT